MSRVDAFAEGIDPINSQVIPPAIETLSEDSAENERVAKLFDKDRLTDEEYSELAEYIDENSHQRLALYFPFSLMPSRKDGNALSAGAEAFVQKYLERFRQLLKTEDYAADFADGDIPALDLQTGKEERVIIATRLIPQLLDRNLLSQTEVNELLTSAERETGVLLASLRQLEDHREALPRLDDLSGVRAYYAQRMAALVTHDTDEKRAAWLASVARDRAATDTARAILLLARSGATSQEHILQLIDDEEPGVAISGIRAATALIDTDANDASQLIERIERRLAQDRTTFVTPAQETLSRLRDAGVAIGEVAERFGVVVPELDAPFGSLVPALRDKIDDVIDKIGRMESFPALKQYMLPLCIGYGSQFKGYAAPESDMDIAVFLKPGTPQDKHADIDRELAQLFGPGVVRFGLRGDHENGPLSIVPRLEAARGVGGEDWAHVLFAGAWIAPTGAARADISNLQMRLLRPYLSADADTLRARCDWQLERDAILSRLLQKGFARLHRVSPMQPVCMDLGTLKPIAGWNPALGSPAFYDDRFRRTASKRFVRSRLPFSPKEEGGAA